MLRMVFKELQIVFTKHFHSEGSQTACCFNFQEGPIAGGAIVKVEIVL